MKNKSQIKVENNANILLPGKPTGGEKQEERRNKEERKNKAKERIEYVA